MSTSSNHNSWSRRKSLFALSPLTPVNATEDVPRTINKLRHGRTPNHNSQMMYQQPDMPREVVEPQSTRPSESSRPARPSLNLKPSIKRPPSVFGSFRSSMRTSSDERQAEAVGEPPYTASSKTPPSGYLDGAKDALTPSNTVVLHGEVQTSAGMFRKKKEYLVLTETHITRYKSQTKAAESFRVIPHPVGRSPTIRHGSMQSVGSQSDLQTLSDSSGDKDGRVPLRHVVAAHRLDDGKPYFAIEVCYLDEESGQASTLTLQFNNPEERDVWLKNIHSTVSDPKLRQTTGISAFNLENAARIVERDNDYDPANCAIFKVVQRQSASKTGGRSSSDDLTKVASTVCFLAVGVHKVHIIQLVKPVARTSSPSLAASTSQASYGTLTLTAIKVSSHDDAFELTFRQPLQRARTIYLASVASHEIAARLHNVENYLRPECGHRLFRFTAPAEIDELIAPAVTSDEEHSCLDRTLIAYCVAYGVNPGNVRYTINGSGEDAPRWELLPPSGSRRPEYGPMELLAIMRALRYNESFGSLSFAGVCLDSLNGLHDQYGKEHVCSRTKRGTPIKLTEEQLGHSCLLVQEVRALAATSKKLRRMDFSGCISTKPTAPMSLDVVDEDSPRTKDLGCGVVEALFPLCKHQTTNVDWICLNGIFLSETDLDYLVGAAVEKSCHLRAIELNRCGLNDRSMGLVLDALRAQDNTLEAIEIAGNTARINPGTFDSQLAMFGFIRKLNLSYVSRTSSNEPLLQAETLLIWRLQELRLSGTALNQATIDSVATYLAHPQSSSLHELFVDHSYLSGRDIATLLHSMSRNPFEARDLHLDISQSRLSKDIEQVTQAIESGLAPSHLSMRAIDYREETQFRKMLNAVTANKTIRYLDMSQTALPGEASEDTCRALERLLAENDTLYELNISGEDSRLATSRFGTGINQALAGLKENQTLQSLRIEKQKLGLQGSSTLAKVLKENKTLRELHCGENEIPLQGLTDLVNSLIENTTLIYLPCMDDGRAAAFKSAEMTMKSMSEMEAPIAAPRSPPFSAPLQSSGSSAMKRGLASVRRGARSASAYTPSFPALPSYRSTPSPTSGKSSPFSISLPPRARQNTPSTVSLPVAFTVQDIQTTHRLLTEQWNRQCYRLGRYLERNWCLLNGIPVDWEVEDEKFERPESGGSIGKMLEQVKYDTTPRAEKERYFDSPQEVVKPVETFEEKVCPSTSGESGERGSVSFKHFILESGTSSPDSDEAVNNMKQLRLDTNLDHTQEPDTPTQAGFPAQHY